MGHPDSGLTQLTRRLAAIGTCVVSDALDASGAIGVAVGITPQAPATPVAGPVRTLELEPYQGGPSVVHLGVRTLSGIRPGEIVVVANGGRAGSAAWGGLLSLAAYQRGVAAVLVDGLVRDVETASSLPLPVFARGVTPVTARGRVRECSADQPVLFSGLQVTTGDFVVADSNGIVCIRSSLVSEVATHAFRLAAFEAKAEEAVRRGEPLDAVLGSRYEAMLHGHRERGDGS